jgi:hypothetical protein
VAAATSRAPREALTNEMHGMLAPYVMRHEIVWN